MVTEKTRFRVVEFVDENGDTVPADSKEATMIIAYGVTGPMKEVTLPFVIDTIAQLKLAVGDEFEETITYKKV